MALEQQVILKDTIKLWHALLRNSWKNQSVKPADYRQFSSFIGALELAAVDAGLACDQRLLQAAAGWHWLAQYSEQQQQLEQKRLQQQPTSHTLGWGQPYLDTSMLIDNVNRHIRYCLNSPPEQLPGMNEMALAALLSEQMRSNLTSVIAPDTRLDAQMLLSYLYLLTYWIADNAQLGQVLLKRERDALAAAMEQVADTSPAIDAIGIALAMTYRLEGQDERAVELLNRLTASTEPELPSASFLYVLTACNRTPEAAADWLLALLPALKNMLERPNVHSYSFYPMWNEVLGLIGQLPERRAAFLDWLVHLYPHSDHCYSQALYVIEDWPRWIDLLLAREADPDTVQASILKPVERDAPELLLPFYHHAVERYVGYRDRSSYKKAVRILKRLARIYKKLKQPEGWEAFLVYFQKRHSRLRSLQQEMRKGKLIE